MAGVYEYVIAGGGLAGASAVSGIRERDREGKILLIGSERHMPYDRPPLSKKLWFGKKKVEDIFLNDKEFYAGTGVDLVMGSAVTAIDAEKKTVTDSGNRRYGYGKLLLATGGSPRTLSIPGGEMDGVCYFRYLDDYLRIRGEAGENKSAVVIGGGFIGSEVAAALNLNKVDVTMIFPSKHIVDRVFPESLGMAIQSRYVEKGVTVLSGTRPVSIEKRGDKFVTKTGSAAEISADIVVVGVGIIPSTGLADSAGLKTGDGIIVNELLQTSNPDIYAAGDNAFFPYRALGKHTRVEHWDNARAQGLHAGRNMAGAKEPYTYMPYFFSDLFEFGYEAVGEVSSGLETFADWQKENDTGVIYYLKDGKVRGVMNCNVWDKVEEARGLILSEARVERQSLRGRIR